VQVAQAKNWFRRCLPNCSGKIGEEKQSFLAWTSLLLEEVWGQLSAKKIARGIDYAIEHKLPFIMISKSGGARMMEAAFL